MSVVVPMLDEQESIVPLYRELAEVASAQPTRYEMIFVDDGSKDQTVDRLQRAAAGDSRVTIIGFARRFGQTAALAAGFDRAAGQVIVPLDADGQNDPHDIPPLLEGLDQPPGYDIVSGWRRNRRDKWLSRKLPSVLANRLARQLTWTPEIRDFGCTMKAYRREVLEDVHLYGEMHRFLPAICKWRGARVTEMAVNHRSRQHGASKYGLRRTIKVLLDLATVKFLGDYLTKPIYFFGKAAILFLLLACLAGLFAVVQKFGYLTEHGDPVNLNDSILIMFAMMTMLMSVMFIMMGVLSELLVRIYHEAQDRRPYKIRRIIRGDDPPPPGTQTEAEAVPVGSGAPPHAAQPSA